MTRPTRYLPFRRGIPRWPTVTADVDTIKSYLPRDSDKLYEWGDEKILEVLDEYNGSLAQTLRRFWYERWSETFEYISITEGGTVRPLEQIWQHASAMLQYWDDQVEQELGRGRITFGDIARPTEDC